MIKRMIGMIVCLTIIVSAAACTAATNGSTESTDSHADLSRETTTATDHKSAVKPSVTVTSTTAGAAVTSTTTRATTTRQPPSRTQPATKRKKNRDQHEKPSQNKNTRTTGMTEWTNPWKNHPSS